MDYLDVVCEIFKCNNMNDIENLKSDFFNDKRFKQYSNSPILKEQIEGAYALREYIENKNTSRYYRYLISFYILLFLKLPSFGREKLKLVYNALVY